VKVGILINSMMGGGAEKVVATLFPEFQKEIRDISLLCLEENDHYRVPGVTPVYLSHQTGARESGPTKLLSLFGFALRLKKWVRENGVDLVQSNIYRSNYVNVLSRMLGSPHRVQIVNHGIPGQYRDEGLSGKVNLWLIRRLYPRADLVICPSQGMIEEFVELGVPREKLRLIPNPVDLEDIRIKAQQELDETGFQFADDKRYIIGIGRLHPVKRMDDLVWAFYELQKNDEDVRLIILGDGDEADALTALLMQLAIGKKVHLAGQVENPYNYLAQSDVLVSASAFEGFSNVIVEALATGTPVISTDCESGPREILAPGTARQNNIEHGQVEQEPNGLLVPVGDIVALTNGMRRLLDNRELCEELVSSGRKRARRFGKDRIAGDYVECIRDAGR
jgi:N-acetylgalactosamine-N,N'-diacetylbacillosaminyl-diphospho-undecaprenol 4-alpha-N-acetylgalactosaminyltransferase